MDTTGKTAQNQMFATRVNHFCLQKQSTRDSNAYEYLKPVSLSGSNIYMKY